MEELANIFDLDVLKSILEKEDKEVIENLKLLYLQSKIYGLNIILMKLATELMEGIEINTTERKYLEKLAETLKTSDYENIMQIRNYLFLTGQILWQLDLCNVFEIYKNILRLASELLVITQI